MKKMLIAAVSAIAVIASVVGCQVYDSQTNANLYHSGVKLQDLAADYNKACVDFKDASTDANKAKILDILIDNFTEHFWEKTAMGSVKSVVNNARSEEIKAWAKEYNKNNPSAKINANSDIYKEKLSELTVRDNENFHDVVWCQAKYKATAIDVADLYTKMIAYAENFYVADSKLKTAVEKTAAKNKFIKEFSNYEDFLYDWNGSLDGGEWSLNSVWEKTHKLKWDYNSKK